MDYWVIVMGCSSAFSSSGSSRSSEGIPKCRFNQLRALLDQYINKPNDNPVKEDRDANKDTSLMTLGDGF